jgi:hypothetical protein
MKMPNERAGGAAGTVLCLHIWRLRPGAPYHGPLDGHMSDQISAKSFRLARMFPLMLTPTQR